MERQPEVLIVGAGLAGLCCALALHRTGVSFAIHEASDGVGGRVRTDAMDGFLLDRGFQVFAAAYPEAHRVLDYPALDLRRFYPGAWIRFEDRFHRVADPWRHPPDAVAGLLSPIGTLRDKLRIGLLRRSVRRGSLEELLDRPEETALAALQRRGFSHAMIDRFFRPFFGGVFLETDLRTSSRMFEFVFRMFASGPTCLPAAGMGRIPEQIAAALPRGSILLGSPVAGVEPGSLVTRGGITRGARAVVVATEAPESGRLVPGLETTGSLPAGCFYFATGRPPVEEPILILDGERRGPIQTLAVLSNVSSRYAPPGEALISISVIGDAVADDSVVDRIRDQAMDWFGTDVEDWRLLRCYRIAHALPDQRASGVPRPQRPVRISRGLYVCGDHRDHGSIQGAMESGRRAAEAVLEDLARPMRP